MELCSGHIRVSQWMIRMQARMLSSEEDFKASLGWLSRFMKRYSLSLSAVSQLSARLCQVIACQSCMVSFILHLGSLLLHHQYPQQQYLCHGWDNLLDGHALLLLQPACIPLLSRQVVNHFTVLTSKADGTKFVVFEGKGTSLIKADPWCC